MQAIRTVLIYGYGVMGRGVAATFSASGFTTIVMSRRKLSGLPANLAAVERLPKDPPGP
jgi:3-hydroxyacyl-CoA dehydrogenase